MPWVLAPDLGGAGAAFLLALLCIAVAYLIRAIAAALPNFHVAFVHIDFGSMFEDATQPIVGWLTGAATALFKLAEDWLRAIPYMLEGLMNDVTGALSHSFSLVDHLFTTVIPDSAGNALSAAEGYADSVAAFVHTEAHNGIAALRSDVAGEVQSAVAGAQGYADAGLGALRDYVDGEIARARQAASDLVGSLDFATPTALATVGAAVVALTSEYEACAVKACAGKSNNFQNLLSDALGVVDVAAFGALVAEVLGNPAAAASDITSWVAGAAGGAQTTLDDLLSL